MVAVCKQLEAVLATVNRLQAAFLGCKVTQKPEVIVRVPLVSIATPQISDAIVSTATNVPASRHLPVVNTSEPAWSDVIVMVVDDATERSG